MKKHYPTTLILENLKIKTYLGINPIELKHKQTVSLYIKIGFHKLPLACTTGKIDDAICYDKLSKRIIQFCTNKKFTLIENLGWQLFTLIKKNIPKKCKLYLRVTKQKPLKELDNSLFEIGE